MQTIVLKPFHHRGEECIGIYYTIDTGLNKLLNKEAGAKWSRTNECWYVPLSKENYQKIVLALKGKAEIQQAALYQYLCDRRKRSAEVLKQDAALQQWLPIVKSSEQIIKQTRTEIDVTGQKKLASHYKGDKICSVNAHIISAMHQHLTLKAYSVSTIKTYLNEVAQFLGLLGHVPADDLQPRHLKRYFVYCFERLQLSENTMHSRINAIKYYYEQVLRREKFFWEIPRPKKPLQLPRFFSQDDIISIIKATENLKHKVMLMLAYSAGLRVSEVVAMKTCNIDTSRMSIFIERAKGKKDRMAGLSPVLLVMLREYIKEYKPEPAGFLFAGQVSGEPYSSRSMQLVIAAAKQKAGIIKPGSVHALRHSFATHLLDKGTDVTIIMKLLGHNDIKTTLRYLHVTNRDILQIISPLDDLKL
ncbi:MAG: tyrosine-type recombinase/integrase [Sediminibacterium sp.]|nr:tyrosine-type recombinase/integrase [Sediminibacterium sp.]MDP3129450.1 tyrosine-type recombinase/integrase [Sediminibacterium sp.]